MSRRLSAVLVSSAFLWTAIATGASAAPASANPAPRTIANQPPLPPGRAVDIRKAQGLEDDDLGPGVIIAGVVGATAVLFLLMFSDSDDDNSSPPTTGTN